MKKSKWYLILINLVALLIFFNYSVYTKENIIRDGQLILLELAPVDPRSLMQGDYMTLRYDLLNNIDRSQLEKRGYCVVRVDDKHIAKAIRFQNNSTPLKEGEKIIKYTSPSDWTTSIGAESYFFQEGQSEKFEKAKYGGIKIDEQGNSLLVGLYDENLKKIE